MKDPQNEYDVEVTADIEVNCQKCDEGYTIYGAILEGNQWKLGYEWECSKCDHKSIEDFDTDDYIG